MDPDKSVKQIKKLYADAKTGRQSGCATWFEVVFPDMADAFFVVGETGNAIPLPEVGQNTAVTLPVSVIVSKYIGLDTKVALTENPAQ